MRLGNTLLSALTAAAMGTASSAMAQIDPFSADLRPPMGVNEPEERPSCPGDGCDDPESAATEPNGGNTGEIDEDSKSPFERRQPVGKGYGSYPQIGPRLYSDSLGNTYGNIGNRHINCYKGQCGP
jgi:hypothetical protein